MKRNCNYCGRIYEADERNLKRGWGLHCSKSCAAKTREKKDYNKASSNLHKRTLHFYKCISYYAERERRYPYSYEGADDCQWGDEEFGIHD